MLSQARLRGDISDGPRRARRRAPTPSPVETQVLHLLRIGWTADANAELRAIFDGVGDKNRTRRSASHA
jgi:hypothetical protein